MKNLKTILFCFIPLVCFHGLYAQTLAFPGAEGYGKHTTGGRGGRVVMVTNLLDVTRNGQVEEGSFRAALNTEGEDPITIVFQVSGLIALEKELKSGRSNMTIAGQTAPGDGICIKNESVKLSGNNIVIRYVRFRPGDELKGQASCLNIENAKNIIIDHCSMSWSIEENMGFYDNKYTTVQWCILSEGLYDSYHNKGPRGYGSQWGGQYASYHHNLLAHNRSRSPRVNGSRAHDTLAIADYRNNVIFNWGGSGAIYGGEEHIPGGKCEVNFINNYYIPGPVSEASFARPSYVAGGSQTQGYGAWYFSGNHMQGITGGMNDDNWLGVEIIDDIGSADKIRSDVAFEVSPITTHTAAEALDLVKENAGATLPVRDAVDERIMKELSGEVAITGDGIIDSQTEVGGWPEYESLLPLADTDMDGMPDAYENEHNLNPEDALDGQEIGADGYSNLERYLNSIVGITGLQEEPSEVLGVVLDSKPSPMFPNPTGNRLYFNDKQHPNTIEIFDMSGTSIISHSVEHLTKNFIEVGSLKPGVYLVRASFGDGSEVSQRICKK